MMKNMMIRNIVSVVLMSSAVNAYAWTGNVNAFLGQKTLDEDDWGSLDKQAEFGVLVDFKQPDWPVSVAVDFLASTDKETEAGIEVEGTTSELNVGVRKIWEDTGSTIRPYIGGGLAVINAELKTNGFPYISDDDSGAGIWLNAGVYWILGQNFNLGLDLRYSQADVTLYGTEGKAGGNHVGLLLGYHW